MNRRNTIRERTWHREYGSPGHRDKQSIAGLPNPEFYHCDLVRDEAGVRLAKRHDSLSICRLREMGVDSGKVRAGTRPARDDETAATSDRSEAA